MIRVLPKYLRRRFLSLFFFSIFGVLILFIIVDLVENLDKFIDARTPVRIVFLYYLYFIPYILVLTIPAVTLLASVFSIGTLAKDNEIVAMKALGYSFYRVLSNILVVGFYISIASFLTAESVVAKTNRRKEQIRKHYLERRPMEFSSRIMDLVIQEPPDKIITIGRFDASQDVAYEVRIETFRMNKMVSRLDLPSMKWTGAGWMVSGGIQRLFDGDGEKAIVLSERITAPLKFKPKELMMAQVKPEEMNVLELNRFIRRLKESKGDARRWLTDLYFRLSFPMSNFFIVLLSVPMAYNLRKKSLAAGFGISLLICFLFFGLVKMGETLGHNAALHPWVAAWMGNAAALAFGVVNVWRVRK